MDLRNLIPAKVVTPMFAGLILLQTSCTTSPYDAPDEEEFGLNTREEMSFDKVDSDADDEVTWPEITATYEDELQHAEWTDPEALVLFDRDMNGFLDRQEYSEFARILEQQLKSASSSMGTDETEGYFTFDDADANSDGVLDEQELSDTTLVEGLQYRLFDDNEDGVLDQEEFHEYLSRRVAGDLGE